MDEERINLKEEFSREREAAMAKLLTEENIKSGRNFIKKMIIPELRKLQKQHPTANIFVITVYVTYSANDYYCMTFNTNQRAGQNAGHDYGFKPDPDYEISREMLIAANEIASEYGIESKQFAEGKDDGFEFKILI